MKIYSDKIEFPTGDKMSDVVGAASQAGGLPTGAIIERGSNASGDYIKYADGTLIQCGNSGVITSSGGPGAGLYSGSLGFSFPIPFIDTNYFISGGAHSFVNWTGWCNVSRGSATGALAYFHSGTATGQCRVTWIAIGRWF